MLISLFISPFSFAFCCKMVELLPLLKFMQEFELKQIVRPYKWCILHTHKFTNLVSFSCLFFKIYCLSISITEHILKTSMATLFTHMTLWRLSKCQRCQNHNHNNCCVIGIFQTMNWQGRCQNFLHNYQTWRSCKLWRLSIATWSFPYMTPSYCV